MPMPVARPPKAPYDTDEAYCGDVRKEISALLKEDVAAEFNNLCTDASTVGLLNTGDVYITDENSKFGKKLSLSSNWHISFLSPSTLRIIDSKTMESIRPIVVNNNSVCRQE